MNISLLNNFGSVQSDETLCRNSLPVLTYTANTCIWRTFDMNRNVITANEINANYGFMQDEVGDLADYSTKTADDEVADKGTCRTIIPIV